MKISLFAITILSGKLAFAGLLYQYSALVTKDLDQMSKIVEEKVKESQHAGGDKVIPLKEGLQAVYCRPNEDGLIEKIISPIKSRLDELDAWELSLKKLTGEALGALKNPKAFHPPVQVTYLVFLENLMAEIKPKAGGEFEKKVLVSIRDAKIEVTKEASHERVLRLMKESVSPSKIAEQILLDFEKAEAAKKLELEKNATTEKKAEDQSGDEVKTKH
jgi:hypothetical protein